MAGEVDGGEPHATRGSRDEHRFTGLRSCSLDQGVVRRPVDMPDRGRRLEVDIGRQRHEARVRHGTHVAQRLPIERVFGVTTFESMTPTRIALLCSRSPRWAAAGAPTRAATSAPCARSQANLADGPPFPALLLRTRSVRRIGGARPSRLARACQQKARATLTRSSSRATSTAAPTLISI